MSPSEAGAAAARDLSFLPIKSSDQSGLDHLELLGFIKDKFNK